MDKLGENLLPWVQFKHFFHLSEDGIVDDNYNCLCLLCFVEGKETKCKAYKMTSANLKSHIKHVHPSRLNDIECDGRGRKRKNLFPDDKKPRVNNFLGAASSEFHIVNQASVDEAIKDYVVRGLQSPDLVESPEFIELVLRLQPGKVVPNQLAVLGKIRGEVEMCEVAINSKLDSLENVATTADYLTVHGRSYLVMAANWICPTTLTRQRLVLACRRIPQDSNLSSQIREIHSQYGIEGKVMCTTTDSGANFDNRSVSEDWSHCVQYHILDDILTREEFSSPHEFCVVHGLNMVSDEAFRVADNDLGFNLQYRASLEKCRVLWKRYNLGFCDFIRSVCDAHLVVPSESGAITEMQALGSLLEVANSKPDALIKCCEGLSIAVIDAADLRFLNEFFRVMQPVTSSIEYLNDERNSFLGLLLPTLHCLRRRLETMIQEDSLVYCIPLVTALLDALHARFQKLWYKRDLILAAVLHPLFQFKWIKNKELEQNAMQWLKEEYIHACPPKISPPTSPIFDFLTPAHLQDEIEIFLTYPSQDLTCMNGLPTLKRLFLKYNTPMPSCFNIVTPEVLKSTKLRDKLFEDILLLKFNRQQ